MNNIVFDKVKKWCPYSPEEISALFKFDLNKSYSNEVQFLCVHCKKEKSLKIGQIRRQIKEGNFTSLCPLCAGQFKRIRNIDFYKVTFPDWVNKWFLYSGKSPNDVKKNIDNGTFTIVNISGFKNSGIVYKCVNCENYITSSISRINTAIKEKRYTGLCNKCISPIRHEAYNINKRKINKGYVIIPKLCVPEKNHWLCDWTNPVLEHRYVMSVSLNRKLYSHEIVHHKDGNRSNNNINNLELWSNSHPSGQKVEDKLNWAREILNDYKELYPHLCLGIENSKEEIKAICFDMDGTIVDMVEWHFLALNKALKDFNIKEITAKEQESLYNGLPTKTKLLMLGITDKDFIEQINNKKQEYTIDIINKSCEINHELINIFKYIKSKGLKIAIVSNSVRKTVELVVDKLWIKPYCDFLVSNEDVQFSKPNPDHYLTAAKLLDFHPKNILAIEDNYYGKQSALRAGLQLLSILKYGDINLDKIKNFI